jgi:hypothetical protein
VSNPREESLLSIWCRGWLDQSHGEKNFNHLCGAQKFLYSEHFPGQSKKISPYYRNWRFITVFTTAPGCSNSETDKYIPWLRISFEILFNTILPSKPRSSRSPLFSRSYNQNRACNSRFLVRGKTPPILFSLTLLTSLAPVNEATKWYNESKRCGKEIILYF